MDNNWHVNLWIVFMGKLFDITKVSINHTRQYQCVCCCKRFGTHAKVVESNQITTKKATKSITQSCFCYRYNLYPNCVNKCHCCCRVVINKKFSFHYDLLFFYVYHYFYADGNIKQVPLISTNILLLIIIELSRQVLTWKHTQLKLLFVEGNTSID